MKIKYEFADGTVSEVEVEESIGAVIIEDRRLEDGIVAKQAQREMMQNLVDTLEMKFIYSS